MGDLIEHMWDSSTPRMNYRILQPDILSTAKLLPAWDLVILMVMAKADGPSCH